ncbi:hypothetical protein V8C37DRAFT_374127 [Trichoderma ceciliae]
MLMILFYLFFPVLFPCLSAQADLQNTDIEQDSCTTGVDSIIIFFLKKTLFQQGTPKHKKGEILQRTLNMDTEEGRGKKMFGL